MRRVLVTGCAGYIGSILTRKLLSKGYFVRGMDILNFGGESLLSIYSHPNFEFFRGDIRKKEDIEKSLENIDSVVHLAAIVGDPACAKDPQIATQTNWEGSKLLFDKCNESKTIQRFIFASTCSNYGKMEGTGYVNEKSPLNPVSLYAKLKVKFEKYILESESIKSLSPTALRFSTVYGISPRMRFDLTVNEFARELTLGKELVIFGEQFWRPYCHVEDLAKACILVLESPKEKVNQQVFGVGDTQENYQKKMLAEIMSEMIPNAKISYVKKDEDPRDYRVEFSKIKDCLGYEINKRVSDGIWEIYKLLKDGILKNPYSKNYQNLK